MLVIHLLRMLLGIRVLVHSVCLGVAITISDLLSSFNPLLFKLLKEPLAPLISHKPLAILFKFDSVECGTSTFILLLHLKVLLGKVSIQPLVQIIGLI